MTVNQVKHIILHLAHGEYSIFTMVAIRICIFIFMTSSIGLQCDLE